uniref:Fork-head domain-containing protein n=1 Tax=Parastrongyloides trichosuri TaxID=131310 RepID=A0A0N4ZE92_PARTI
MIIYQVGNRLDEELSDYMSIKTEVCLGENEKDNSLNIKQNDASSTTAFTPTASLPPSRNSRASFSGITAPIIRLRDKTDKTKREISPSNIRVYKPQKRQIYQLPPKKVVCLGPQKLTGHTKYVPGANKTVTLSQKQPTIDTNFIFPSQPSPPTSETSSNGCIDYSQNFSSNNITYEDSQQYIVQGSDNIASYSNRQTPEADINHINYNIIDCSREVIYEESNYVADDDIPSFSGYNDNIQINYLGDDGSFDPSSLYYTEEPKQYGTTRNVILNPDNLYEVINDDLSREELTTTLPQYVSYMPIASSSLIPSSKNSNKTSVLRQMLARKTPEPSLQKGSVNVRVIKSDIEIPQTETTNPSRSSSLEIRPPEKVSESRTISRNSSEPCSGASIGTIIENEYSPFHTSDEHSTKQNNGENREQVVKKFDEDIEFKHKFELNSAYEKPQLPYAAFVTLILNNLNTEAISVSEVYDGIIFLFPHFETAYEGWRNSIRHNLSMSRLYQKVEARIQIGSRKACMWSMVKTEEPFNFNEVHKIDENLVDHIKSTMRFPQLWFPLTKGDLKLFPLNYKSLDTIIPEYLSEKDIDDYVAYIRKYAYYLRRLGSKHFMKSPKKNTKGRRKRIKKDEEFDLANINLVGDDFMMSSDNCEPNVKRSKIDYNQMDYNDMTYGSTNKNKRKKTKSKEYNNDIDQYMFNQEESEVAPFCLTPDEEESILNNYLGGATSFSDISPTFDELNFPDISDSLLDNHDIMLEGSGNFMDSNDVLLGGNGMVLDENKENYESEYQNNVGFDTYDDLNLMYGDRMDVKTEFDEMNAINSIEYSLKDANNWSLDNF